MWILKLTFASIILCFAEDRLTAYDLMDVADSCDNTTSQDLKGTLTWPDTRIGQTRIVPCPIQLAGFEAARAFRRCSKSSDGLGVWAIANTSACPFESKTTQELQKLVQVRSILILRISSNSSIVLTENERP